MNNQKRESVDHTGNHLSVEAIIDCALDGDYDAHFECCAFCREQFKMLRELHSDTLTESSESVYEFEYALAAQHGGGDAGFRLRRTWYSKDGRVIIRILEDEQNNALIGFLLRDPADITVYAISIEGLETAFRPDASGRFLIGPAELRIESLNIELLTTESSA